MVYVHISHPTRFVAGVLVQHFANHHRRSVPLGVSRSALVLALIPQIQDSLSRLPPFFRFHSYLLAQQPPQLVVVNDASVRLEGGLL